jgi:uracil-DNA glycosylase
VSAQRYLPDRRNVTALRRAAAACHGCDLYKDATQTVFSQGPVKARLMMIGEQPGDREDIEGKPFVGPAGRMLDKLMDDVGIERGAVYLTNAVKHFAFTPAERGKRRLHRTPNHAEITACRPWWIAEVEAVRPELLVCLGAVAAKAVLGPKFRVTQQRGELLEPPEEIADNVQTVLATLHPSAILRAKDRRTVYAGLRDDLAKAAAEINRAGAGRR